MRKHIETAVGTDKIAAQTLEWRILPAPTAPPAAAANGGKK